MVAYLAQKCIPCPLLPNHHPSLDKARILNRPFWLFSRPTVHKTRHFLYFRYTCRIRRPWCHSHACSRPVISGCNCIPGTANPDHQFWGQPMGLSRLSDQKRMVAMLRGSRPNQFCECAIVGLRATFYIVMCDINTTTY